MFNAKNMRYAALRRGTLLVVASVALAGCAPPVDDSPSGTSPKVSVSTQPATQPIAAAVQQNVSANGNGFAPSSLTVARGTTVVWTSTTGNVCTIVSGVPQKPGAGPLNGVLEGQGAVYSYKFDIPGDYPYFNSTIPIQAGTITVSP